MPLTDITSHNKHTDERTWKELDLKALEHNVRVISGIMPHGCQLMAILKANAYGHGVYEIATALSACGVNAFAVATIDEGIEVRSYGIDGSVLVLGYTPPNRASDLKKYGLSQCVFDADYAKALSSRGERIAVHIAIDSGMHRLGIEHTDIEALKLIYSLKNLTVEGIFSHLCVSDSDDEADIDYTHKQILAFNSAVASLRSEGYPIPHLHLQSSYGLLNYRDTEYDYARIGIILYGIDSSDGLYKDIIPDVRPVLSLKTRIIQIRELESGRSVSYGRTFTTSRKSRIAVLPIGYADGYPRSLSGKDAYVLVCGKKAPIVGRICMDQLMIDVTDISSAEIGSVATLIGTDGELRITAEQVAAWADTITNELLCRLGARLTVMIK